MDLLKLTHQGAAPDREWRLISTIALFVKVELLVLRSLSLYLLLPWSGGLTDDQQDWQERSARFTLLLQRTLHDYVILSHQITRPHHHHHQQQQQQTQAPSADLLHSGMHDHFSFIYPHLFHRFF